MSFGLMARGDTGYNNVFVDDDGWLVFKDGGPVNFVVYKYDGVTYLKVADSGTWNGKYLSVNKNGYLGLYGWSGASGWSLSDDRLISKYTGKAIGHGSGAYYQAASGVEVVRFEEHQHQELHAGF